MGSVVFGRAHTYIFWKKRRPAAPSLYYYPLAIFLTAAYGPGPAGARARQPGAHWRCDETNDTFGHQTGVPHVTRGHAGPMTELLLRTVGFRDSSIARVALSDGPMLKGGER